MDDTRSLVNRFASSVITLWPSSRRRRTTLFSYGSLANSCSKRCLRLGGRRPFGGIVLHPQMVEKGQDTRYGRDRQPQPQEQDEDPAAIQKCDILPAEVLPHYILTRPFSQAKHGVGGAKGAGKPTPVPDSFPQSTYALHDDLYRSTLARLRSDPGDFTTTGGTLSMVRRLGSGADGTSSGGTPPCVIANAAKQSQTHA